MCEKSMEAYLHRNSKKLSRHSRDGVYIISHEIVTSLATILTTYRTLDAGHHLSCSFHTIWPAYVLSLSCLIYCKAKSKNSKARPRHRNQRDHCPESRGHSSQGRGRSAPVLQVQRAVDARVAESCTSSVLIH